MIDPSTLWLFSLAALALLVVPGPAVLYIVGQAIDGGRKAGLVSMLGIQTGGLVHVCAAAVGISALIASSGTAFTVVKLAGAAYLVVIGVLTLLRREPIDPDTQAPAERTPRRRYLQGIVVNILNPKTALFFLAFLPQFVDEDAGQVGLQVVVLGLVFLTLAVVSDGAWALAAGTAGEWLRHHRGFLRARRYVSGSVFVALGVLTAFARRSHA